MTTKHKLFVTAAVVIAFASAGALGTFAAFTARTTNTGNAISSGTVNIGQHAGWTSLYSLANQGGGATNESCIRINYSGTLAAAVKLYVSAGITNGTFFNLKVERGSGLSSPGAGMSCAGFASGSTVYDADIGGFATTYAGGYDGKAGGAAWTQNNTVDYRFTVTTKDNTTPNAMTTARSTGAHTFTWEARNN